MVHEQPVSQRTPAESSGHEQLLSPVGQEPDRRRTAHPPRRFASVVHRPSGGPLSEKQLRITAAGCAAAVIGLTVLVKTSPYIAFDDAILRAIQSLDLGPLTAPFPFFRWAGGPGGTYMAAATIALVLLFNRRAWLVAVGWVCLVASIRRISEPAFRKN